jgi:hypothetical protein
MTAPAWAPGLPDVGAYITSRTLDNAVPGNDTPTGTFSESTYPTDAQVDPLIDQACQWVTVKTGTVSTTLYDLAKSTASLRIAGLVELSFPLRDADVSNAELLLAQADASRADLAAANIEITGVDPSNPAAVLVPVYAFPDPPWWGDYNRLGS